MRRTAVGPLKIIERRNKFEVRKGRTILSKHDSYVDAEDAALRRWLHKKRHDDETDHVEQIKDRVGTTRPRSTL